MATLFEKHKEDVLPRQGLTLESTGDDLTYTSSNLFLEKPNGKEMMDYFLVNGFFSFAAVLLFVAVLSCVKIIVRLKLLTAMG